MFGYAIMAGPTDRRVQPQPMTGICVLRAWALAFQAVWTIGDLLDAALATQPIDPIVTAPDRRKRFTVIDGGKQ
ncbi:MAG: hypothetical protein PSV22_07675 [Pseudolabrys sp.]|nr:hypothetical protein [Pseudolabrys sp.]